MKRAIAFVMLGAISACGPLVNGRYRGEPVVTVRGALTVAEGREIGDGVHLAVAWYAPTQGRPLGSVLGVTAVESRSDNPFPQRFEAELFGLPPVGGSLDGVIVAFHDLNGSGALDLAFPGVASPDVVLGSSADTGPGVRLVFIDTEPASSPMGLRRGYNLVRGGEVAALSTSVPIELTGAQALQVLVCQSPTTTSGQSPDGCGRTAPLGDLEVTGSVGVADGLSAVDLTISDTFGALSAATVAVNGRAVPYDAVKRRYSLRDSTTPFLIAGQSNTLVVSAAGFREITTQVPLAGPFQLTAPTFNAIVPKNDAFTVSWSAASGAVTGYRARVFDAAFVERFSRVTMDNAVVVPALMQIGNATVNVEALQATVPCGTKGFVVPYVNQGVPIRVQ